MGKEEKADYQPFLTLYPITNLCLQPNLDLTVQKKQLVMQLSEVVRPSNRLLHNAAF